MLSRGVCHYRAFPLPAAIRGARREAALRLQIREWSPFVETGSIIQWHGRIAGVWIWDAARVQAAMKAEGLNPEAFTVLPETVVRERPAVRSGSGEPTVRLVACLDGVEAQVWRDGALMHSRWWAARPQREAWRIFRSAAGIGEEIGQGVPSVVEIPWIDRPWAGGPGFSLRNLQSLPLEKVAAVAVFLLVLPLVYQAGEIARLRYEIADIKEQASILDRQVEPILADRQAALAGISNARVLLGKVAPFPDQLTLLAAVSERLPARSARIISWSWQDGQLSFTLAGEDTVDAQTYVAAFEAVPDFEQVRVETDIDLKQLTISLKVKPQWQL